MSTNSKYTKVNLEFNNIDNLLSKESFQEIHPLLPKRNFRMTVCGGSGSGKTSFIVQLITRHLIVRGLYICAKHLDQPKMVYIIDFYRKMEKDLSKKLKKEVSIIKVITNDLEEFPDVSDIEGEDNIVIFDDMVMEKDPTNKIVNYYIRGRHHNISSFYLSQSFFTVPKNIRLNTNIYALFNMVSLNEVSRIHREVASDLTKKQFIDIFNEATDGFNFLYIDTTHSKKILKYRKNLDETLMDFI